MPNLFVRKMSRFETILDSQTVGRRAAWMMLPSLENHREVTSMEKSDIAERAAFYLGKGFH